MRSRSGLFADEKEVKRYLKQGHVAFWYRFGADNEELAPVALKLGLGYSSQSEIERENKQVSSTLGRSRLGKLRNDKVEALRVIATGHRMSTHIYDRQSNVPILLDIKQAAETARVVWMKKHFSTDNDVTVDAAIVQADADENDPFQGIIETSYDIKCADNDRLRREAENIIDNYDSDETDNGDIDEIDNDEDSKEVMDEERIGEESL
jgi:hypothetical protein